jgi:hypothetical protein
VHNSSVEELLYVLYLNHNTIKIRGIFSCSSPRLKTVFVSDSTITDGPLRINGERDTNVNIGLDLQ